MTAGGVQVPMSVRRRRELLCSDAFALMAGANYVISSVDGARVLESMDRRRGAEARRHPGIYLVDYLAGTVS